MGEKRYCIDVCHEFWGAHYEKYNDLGDSCLVLNALVLLIALPYSYSLDVGRIFGLFMAMMVFREAISLVTRCESSVNKEHRPWLGGDDRWYVISGHLLTSMLTTYLVYISQVQQIWKLISILLTFSVFFLQVMTREHYSKDMMITALLVWLLIKAYA